MGCTSVLDVETAENDEAVDDEPLRRDLSVEGRVRALVVGATEDREGLDVISTGGIYEPRSRSYIGLPAESTLRKFNITRMFFSCKGVHVERGISESNSRQAAFKERVIACSEEICLLADSTKIGLKSSFFFAQISDLTTLITNPDADPEVLALMGDLGVDVLTT